MRMEVPMKPDPILDDVTRLVARAAKAPRQRVHPGDTLAHLGIDSLGRLNLATQLEERFSVTLGEEAAQGAMTPGGLARAIRVAGGRAGRAA